MLILEIEFLIDLIFGQQVKEGNAPGYPLGTQKTWQFPPLIQLSCSPPPLLQVPQRWIQPLPHLHDNGASVQPNTRGTQTGSEPLSPGNMCFFPLQMVSPHPFPMPRLVLCPLPCLPLHSVMSRFGPYLAIHRRCICSSSEHGHDMSPLWIF